VTVNNIFLYIMTSISSNIAGAAAGQCAANTIQNVGDMREYLLKMGYNMIDRAKDNILLTQWGQDGNYLGDATQARSTQLQHAEAGQLVNELFFRQTDRFTTKRNDKDAMKKLNENEYRRLSIILSGDNSYIVFNKQRYEEEQKRRENTSRKANAVAASTAVATATITGNLMSEQKTMSSALQKTDQYLAVPLSAAAVSAIDYMTPKTKEIQKPKQKDITQVTPEIKDTLTKLQEKKSIDDVDNQRIVEYLDFLNNRITNNQYKITQNKAKIVHMNFEKNKKMKDEDEDGKFFITEKTKRGILQLSDENVKLEESVNKLFISLRNIYLLLLQIKYEPYLEQLKVSEQILYDNDVITNTKINTNVKKHGVVSRGRALMNSMAFAVKDKFPDRLDGGNSVRRRHFRKSNKRIRIQSTRKLKRKNQTKRRTL
jgi:hypothetical protein